MRNIIKNKKAYSMSGWTEGILFSVLFVMILGIAFAGMNASYGKSYSIGLDTNATQEAFIQYQDTIDSQIGSGEADFTSASGLTLKSSWGIITSGTSIIWSFLTGGWIETIVGYMNLPPEVGLIFRILYFLSIGFIILKILFKVKA